MTKLTIRIRDKDLGMLRRAAKKANMPPAEYAEQAVEVWLSREREEERCLDAERQRQHLSSSLTAHAVVQLPR